MPICIAGMHRAGTSMMTKLLRLGGLSLGEESQLMQPLPENQDGFWEHMRFVALNDDVLESLGGWWDCPPAQMPAGWEVSQSDRLRAELAELTGTFAGREPWGWKDPRNSLTLPLWRRVFTDMKVVVCLRNPLEVAVSLKKRNTFSYALSLRLWHAYYSAILRATTPQERIVTHYDAFFRDDVRTEVARVLMYCGLDSSDDTVERCVSTAIPSLRHSRLTTQDLVDSNVPSDVVQLYLQLCEEALWFGDSGRPGVMHPSAPEALPAPVTEIQTLAPAPALGAARLDKLAQLRKEVASLREEIALLRGQYEGGVTHRETLEGQIVELRQTIACQHERIEEDGARASQLTRRDVSMREMLAESRKRIIYLEDLLKHMLESVAKAEAEARYPLLVKRIRKAVRETLPRDAWIAVVSKGDEALLELGGRRASHFPQDEKGGYAGYTPANSADAAKQLDALRDQGVTHLLVPSTAFWWFEYYPEFGRQLSARNVRLKSDDDLVLFELAAQLAEPVVRCEDERPLRPVAPSVGAL